jgi:putative transposase
MSEDDGLKVMGQVIQIDEARIRDHHDKMVRGTVEETLNALLDADADRLCRLDVTNALKWRAK